MEYGFDDDVRTALRRAMAAAGWSGSRDVGSEHMLLGLVAAGDPFTERLLARHRDLQAVLEVAVPPEDEGATPTAEYAYRASGRRVLEAMLKMAREGGPPGAGAETGPGGAGALGTAHMWRALAGDRDVAGVTLRRFGVDVEEVTAVERGAAEDEGGSAAPGAGATGSGGTAEGAGAADTARSDELAEADEPAEDADAAPASPAFALEIDDASALTISEQIVARVREGVATGRLRPGERLPPVRTLADRLEIAPGTVARAYGDLERSGLVVTRGPRGTFVAEVEGSVASRERRLGMLVERLRPVAVEAYLMGADTDELDEAMARVTGDIFGRPSTDEGR